MNYHYCSILEFTNEENGEICAICKKSIRKSQIVIQCPKCLTYFHYDHILSWYQQSNLCPVCSTMLVIDINEELATKEAKEKNNYENDVALNINNTDSIVLENPEHKRRIINPIFYNVLFLCLGTILVSYTLYDIFRYGESISWDFLYYIPVLIIGYLFLYYGLSKKIFFSDIWEEIAFKENNILITKNNQPYETNLQKSNIRKIEIRTYEDEVLRNDFQEDVYRIELKITTKGYREYHFKTIYDDESSQKSKQIYHNIITFVEKNYPIKVKFISSNNLKHNIKRIFQIAFWSAFASYVFYLILYM